MDTINAVRWHPARGIRLEQEAPRELVDGEAAIEPLAVGLCGTDLHILDGSFAAEPGVVLGHEICGRVIEVKGGAGRIVPGDLVTVEPHRYCTECFYCRAGDEHLCDERKGYGVRLDGGLTERMVAPQRVLFRLPADMDPLIGALTEPVACCLHAMDMLAARSGESILIQGCGPAGAILVSLARLSGLVPIVVAEPRPDRRDLALRMGADAVYDPTVEGWQSEALGLTHGTGFRNVVDAVGKARLLELAVVLAARGGRILVFGVAEPGETARIEPRELFAKELTLLSSLINPYTHQRAVELLPRLGLDRLRNAVFPLGEVAAAFETQRASELDKVYVRPCAVGD